MVITSVLKVLWFYLIAVIWISATLALMTPCSSTVQGFKRLVLKDIVRANQGKLLSFVILIEVESLFIRSCSGEKSKRKRRRARPGHLELTRQESVESRFLFRRQLLYRLDKIVSCQLRLESVKSDRSSDFESSPRVSSKTLAAAS